MYLLKWCLYKKDEFCHSPGYAAETFVTTNCLFMVDLPATAAPSQQLASRQEPTWGNIINDLFAVVNRLLQFVGALSGRNTCLTGFKSRLEGQRVCQEAVPGGKPLLCAAAEVARNSVLSKHNNWYESTSQLSRQLFCTAHYLHSISPSWVLRW